MTRRLGTWPAYRRSLAPAGCCVHCWAEGGAPIAGKPYVWGWPSTVPDQPLMFYCDAHAESCRRQAIQLVPIILPTEFTAVLHCPAEPAA